MDALPRSSTLGCPLPSGTRRGIAWPLTTPVLTIVGRGLEPRRCSRPLPPSRRRTDVLFEALAGSSSRRPSTWTARATKPRHLQLADPWGGRERSARHCPPGRPDRGEGPSTFGQSRGPLWRFCGGRFHPRPVQKQDSGARVGRCYEFAADLRAAGDGVSSRVSSTAARFARMTATALSIAASSGGRTARC